MIYGVRFECFVQFNKHFQFESFAIFVKQVIGNFHKNDLSSTDHNNVTPTFELAISMPSVKKILLPFVMWLFYTIGSRRDTEKQC